MASDSTVIEDNVRNLLICTHGDREAVFSKCGAYRYRLTIGLPEIDSAELFKRPGTVEPSLVPPTLDRSKHVLFCCLNPSTATEREDDRTVAKLQRFARKWGYGTVTVVNAYAFRSTDPKVMQAATEPVGVFNDEEIYKAANHADLRIAAWGNNCDEKRRERVEWTLRLLGPLHVLKINPATGIPAHPLYLRESLTPQLWERE